MFTTIIGAGKLIFKDVFIVVIDQTLFGVPSKVIPIIDEIFNLDDVLIVNPNITSGRTKEDPEIRGYIELKVTTKPIYNEEDAGNFTNILLNVNNVSFVHAQKTFEYLTTEEIINHSYGGIRTKL